MTSIHSIISIETRLVTHFSGYKTNTLHEKAMLYIKTAIFTFLLIEMLQNFVEVFISFCIGYPDILNILETIVYSLCFKKQTLELLLHLSFKAELPTDGL